MIRNYVKHNRNTDFTPLSKTAGFTLVETLVAITILLLVIVGPMTAAQKGIQQSYFSNEQIVATFLAQEGIEAMRQLRDEYGLNALENGDSSDLWLTDTDDGVMVKCQGSNGCRLDKELNLLFDTCGDDDCNVKVVTATGEYIQDGLSAQSGEAETGYTRRIRVSNDDGNDNVEVTSTVSWNSSIFGGQRQVTIQTWIYDQYRRYEP